MKAGVDGARDYGRRASCFLMYTVVPASTRVARALLARLPSRISEHDWTRLAHARPLGEERERDLTNARRNFFAACRSPYSLCVCVPIAFCESVCLYRLLPFLRRPTRSRDDEAAARQALLRRRQRERVERPESANAWIPIPSKLSPSRRLAVLQIALPLRTTHHLHSLL